MQAYVPIFVDHVTLGMPVLVLTVAVNLDELFEDCVVAAMATLGEAGRIVIMAINLALVLVVAVLRAEYGGTDGTGEVLDVVFVVEGGYIGASQGIVAGVADKIEATEVIFLAERVLVGTLVGHREEL